MIVSTTRPNIVFFFWDNLGWGEVGCYGGGVLRGAPTPRIDSIAAAGLKLLNFNVEAQCTPSRSALLTGRHPIRSGTSLVPATGGPDGLTRWEVTIAQALADAGYATGMWGKWHLGSDPEQRSPVDFGFDEAVWCPRTADEVLWTMQSYFPDGSVTATPYAGEAQVLLEHESIYSRRKGEGPEVLATYDAVFRAESTARSPTGLSSSCAEQRRTPNHSSRTCHTHKCTFRRSPTPSSLARPNAATSQIS
jgi:arylsulfatase